MYQIRPGLVLGFHGCDSSTQKSVVCRKTDLKSSANDWDWLGHGIYFWEFSPERALEYANVLKEHPERSKNKIYAPSVLGAVINLGKCLDLLDYRNLNLLKTSYEILKNEAENEGKELPKNSRGKDLLIRNQACAVIENLHTIMHNAGQKSFDSIRGVFWEGEDLYPGAGFKQKDHIQLCIINPNCIKGYFLPRNLETGHEIV